MQIIVNKFQYIITEVKSIPKLLRHDLITFIKGPRAMGDGVPNPIGITYDITKSELRIPSSYPVEKVKVAFPQHIVMYNNKEVGHDVLPIEDIVLTGKPRDFRQDHIITFLCGEGPYTRSKASPMVYTNADTGDGKTMCGVAAICYYKMKTLIIPPANPKLTRQWIESVTKFSSLSKDRVCVLSQTSGIEKFIEGKVKGDIYIVPRDSLLGFIKRYGNEAVTMLCKTMGIGLVIVDEAHEATSTVVDIINYLQGEKLIKMSSSPYRSKDDENTVYNNLFGSVPMLGKELKTVDMNHIVSLMVMMENDVPGKINNKIYLHNIGLSQSGYERYLRGEYKHLTDDEIDIKFMEHFIFTMYTLLTHQRDDGKVLIIVASIEMCYYLTEIINDYFPHLTVGQYIAENKNRMNELDRDVIIGTHKGVGTGMDLVNHQLTINVMSYSSRVLADQLPGRNRNNHPTRKSIYSEIVMKGYRKTDGQYKRRKPFIARKSKNGKVIEYRPSQGDIQHAFDQLGRGVVPINGEYINIKKKTVILSPSVKPDEGEKK